MKWISFTAAALFLAVAAGCASNGTELAQSSASLSFANPGTASGVPGSFHTLGGKTLPDRPSEITVPAGRQTIGYFCPDTVIVDGPLIVKATFESGKKYVLHCEANQPATIKSL